MLTVGLDRAIELLSQAKRRSTELVRELGPHPADGQVVGLYTGRYGPYVKHGKTNASLPKDVSPETITLEQAVELLSQKKTQKSTKRRSSGTVKSS